MFKSVDISYFITKRVGVEVFMINDNIFTGRIAAKRQTAGIKFTHRLKISIFAPHGRLVAPIHMKIGMAEGHVGLLGRAKFGANQCTGVGTRPPKLENFHFLVKSRPAGANPLTDFYNC